MKITICQKKKYIYPYFFKERIVIAKISTISIKKINIVSSNVLTLQNTENNPFHNIF